MPLKNIETINGDSVYVKEHSRYGENRFYCGEITIPNESTFDKFEQYMNNRFGPRKNHWHIVKGKVRRRFYTTAAARRRLNRNRISNEEQRPQTLRVYVNWKYFDSSKEYRRFLENTEVYYRLTA